MVIEEIYGIQTTGLTMDQRFTLLAAAAPECDTRQNQRPPPQFENLNNKNKNLLEQIARQLAFAQQKQNGWQGNGMRQQGPRRYGSESNLSGLGRSNSFSNMTQQSDRSRPTYRSNSQFRDRSRSVSVSSAPSGRGQRGRSTQRGRYRNYRGGRQTNGVGRGRVQRRGTAREGLRSGTNGLRSGTNGLRSGTNGLRGGTNGVRTRANGLRTGSNGLRGGAGGQRGNRGGARGRGNRGNRGGVSRAQTPKQLPTKEELDAQLDEYMAGSKAALDRELDEYMKDAAMDIDVIL